MTDIETFLWDGIDLSSAPCVGRIGLANASVTMVVVSAANGHELATLSFPDAIVTSIWFDEKDPVTWPLDIIGFDSYPAGEQWRFVLNCSTVEFGWTSAWPSKVRTIER